MEGKIGTVQKNLPPCQTSIIPLGMQKIKKEMEIYAFQSYFPF